MGEPLPDWALQRLVCPRCRGRVTQDRSGDFLRHDEQACDESYPVIDGVPRLLLGSARASLVRARGQWFDETPARAAVGARWSSESRAADHVVDAFDAEWSRFSRVGDDELREIFSLYSDVLDEDAFRRDCVVVDAGCGAGRWAVEVAKRGPLILAMDLGLSVELANANTRASGRVCCVQADIHHLPVVDASVDWAYSLGVLHYLPSAVAGLGPVVRAVRPGGQVLVYHYYALDIRGPAFRGLFAIVDRTRRIVSRLPRPVVVAFAEAVAAVVYWPVARSAAALEALGARRAAAALPLSFYRHRAFRVMRNDALGRFGTRMEHRFTREQLVAAMSGVGLDGIEVSPHPPFWHAVGRRRSS